MFGTLGGPELFLILVVALIVFGPRKLPEIGKSIGKMMGEFRRASNEFRRTIEEEVEAEKIREATKIEPPRFDYGSDTPASSAAPADSAGAAPLALPESSGAPASTDTTSPGADAPQSDAPGATGPSASGTAATAEDGAPPPDTVSRGDLPAETK